jgi:hypothetical protein
MIPNLTLYLLGLAVVLTIIFTWSLNRKQKVYYFLDDSDDYKDLEELLNNTKNEVIIVNYKNIDTLELNKVLASCSNSKKIKKVLNLEKMEDVQELVVGTCYKNYKCANRPKDAFYAINEKLNVYGYPFDFEDGPYELDPFKKYDPNTNMNRLRQLIDVPSCGRKRGL